MNEGPVIIDKHHVFNAKRGDSYQLPASSIYINDDGRIIHMLTNKIEDKIDGLDPKRFENTYVNIPYPMSKGSLVKVISGPMAGTLGLAKTSEDWKEYSNDN